MFADEKDALAPAADNENVKPSAGAAQDSVDSDAKEDRQEGQGAAVDGDDDGEEEAYSEDEDQSENNSEIPPPTGKNEYMDEDMAYQEQKMVPFVEKLHNQVLDDVLDKTSNDSEQELEQNTEG